MIEIQTPGPPSLADEPYWCSTCGTRAIMRTWRLFVATSVAPSSVELVRHPPACVYGPHKDGGR